MKQNDYLNQNSENEREKLAEMKEELDNLKDSVHDASGILKRRLKEYFVELDRLLESAENDPDEIDHIIPEWKEKIEKVLIIIDRKREESVFDLVEMGSSHDDLGTDGDGNERTDDYYDEDDGDDEE